MKTMNRIGMAALLVACAPATGCAMDSTGGAGAPAERTGTSAQALSEFIQVGLGGTASSDGIHFTNGKAMSQDLGVGDGWTCFLAGVAGNISPPFSTVGVDQDTYTPNNDWFLSVQPLAGETAVGAATCIPSTLLPAAALVEHSVGYLSGVDLAGNTGPFDQFCGLASISTFSSTDWARLDSYALVSDDGNNPDWVYEKNGATWTSSEEAANSSAECAQAPVSQIFTYDVAPGSNFELEYDGKPLPSGTACFLSEVIGAFRSNDPSDGVLLSLDAQDHWHAAAGPQKSGFVLCYN
jgi:hypothetical protein